MRAELEALQLFPVTFDGREEELEFDDVIKRLRSSMDIAFWTAMEWAKEMDVKSYDISNAEYAAAKEAFMNEGGIPFGGALYGLFLNQFMAGNYGTHSTLKYAENAVIENLEIHDLKHRMLETIRLDKWGVAPYKNAFDAALNAKALLGGQQLGALANGGLRWSKARYTGNVLTDAVIVLDLVARSTGQWAEGGQSLIGEEFRFEMSVRRQWWGQALFGLVLPKGGLKLFGAHDLSKGYCLLLRDFQNVHQAV